MKHWQAHKLQPQLILNEFWFLVMGTKQTPSSNQSNDFSTPKKKQMIHSRIALNRLLIKTFLKKATDYKKTIA
jgi:hypothetical protein